MQPISGYHLPKLMSLKPIFKYMYTFINMISFTLVSLQYIVYITLYTNPNTHLLQTFFTHRFHAAHDHSLALKSPHSLTLHHCHSLASLQLLAVPRTIQWSHSLLPLYMAYCIIIDQIIYCDAKKIFPLYWCTEMAWHSVHLKMWVGIQSIISELL